MGCQYTKPVIQMKDGQYRLVETLGEGAFSTVYLAARIGLKKEYAIKKIMIHDLEQYRSALKEVEYHMILRHKNILPCLGYLLVDDTSGFFLNTYLYIRLPYCFRGTLDNEIRMYESRRQRFSLEYILYYMKNICEGLEVFHNYPLYPLAHHDLKPANIGLHNEAVILDLGSTGPASFELNTRTQVQKMQDFVEERCSMPYRAPELFHLELDGFVDQRSDIWSLGCILFSMCYYKCPFETVYERGDSIALAVVSGHIEIPDTHYPQEVNDLIKSMMQFDPKNRPFVHQVLEKVMEINHSWWKKYYSSKENADSVKSEGAQGQSILKKLDKSEVCHSI